LKIKSFIEYRQGNLKPIWESKGMLDISIQAASKYLTSDSKKDEFLSTPLIIEEKLDGVKVTIIKKDNTGRAEEDYIVSYKNNLIFPFEHDFVSGSHIKKKSIGASQLQKVWDHLKKLRKNNIPIGTELFCEFLMRKPTLSSKYSKLHQLILIGYSKSTWNIKDMKVFTNPKGFFTDKREEYARELKINVPPLLFDGILSPRKNFLKGIKDEVLLSLFRERADQINWDNPDAIIHGISEMLLDRQSNYGGKPEGAVIKYKNKNVILKFLQPYQLDQKARLDIKNQFRGTIEQEDEYWDNVYKSVDEILKKVNISNPTKTLKEIAKILKTYKINFTHVVKNDEQIKEDIQLSAKIVLSRKIAKGALILGKFRILTIAHYDIIKEALAKYEDVTVAIISSKETKGTKKLRNEIMEACFGNKIEIINASSGRIVTLLEKSKNNISTVIAGSDRVENYKNQLREAKGIKVEEVLRADEDISASKIIENLHDYDYFRKNTPTCVHKYYQDYLKVYG